MAVNLDSVRDRVRECQGLTYVGNAIEAADAMENMAAPVPCAYVSIAREGASPNKNSAGRHTQMVTSDLSVLMAFGAQRADAGLTDEVEAVRIAVRDLLMAWTAEGAGLPFDYISYSVRFMGNGLLWVEQLFRTKYLVSKDA